MFYRCFSSLRFEGASESLKPKSCWALFDKESDLITTLFLKNPDFVENAGIDLTFFATEQGAFRASQWVIEKIEELPLSEEVDGRKDMDSGAGDSKAWSACEVSESYEDCQSSNYKGPLKEIPL